MKRNLLTYIIWSFGLLLLGTQPAIDAETLSKKAELRVKTIVIDPWYGGEERGPRIGQKYGKDITLEIAQKLRGLLETAGFIVYLTRDADRIVPLEDRLYQGRSKSADIHLAIKASTTKKDCIRIFAASPPVKEIKQNPEMRTREEFNAQLGEILKNLEAASIRADSISLAATISNNLKSGSVSNCVGWENGKGFLFENSWLPTVMVDFQISNRQPNISNDASLDQIIHSLVNAIKIYSVEHAPREVESN